MAHVGLLRGRDPLRDHYQRFGIEIGGDEARRRFVNRAITVIFDSYLPNLDRYDHVRRSIVAALGEVDRAGIGLALYLDDLAQYIKDST